MAVRKKPKHLQQHWLPAEEAMVRRIAESYSVTFEEIVGRSREAGGRDAAQKNGKGSVIEARETAYRRLMMHPFQRTVIELGAMFDRRPHSIRRLLDGSCREPHRRLVEQQAILHVLGAPVPEEELELPELISRIIKAVSEYVPRTGMQRRV